MSIRRRKALLLLLAALSLVDSTSTFASCRNCETVLGVYECQENCEGETCFTLHNLATESPDRYLKQGCLYGAQASPGCRTNQDGYTLCVCLDDDCNTLENATAALAEKAAVELDSVACRHAVNFSIAAQRRHRQRPCAGSFCTFQSVEVTPFESPAQTTETRNCALTYDFDVFTTASKFFFYPESCALEEFTRGMKKTTCACSKPRCNSEIPFPVEAGEVVCHMSKPPIPFNVNDSRQLDFDEDDDGEDVCRGEFCVHLVSIDGSVHRGCLSLNQTGSDRQLSVGFYKHYLGWEQRLCDSDYCNANLTSMEGSWPEELAIFRARSSILPHRADLLASSSTTVSLLLLLLLLPSYLHS